MNFADAMTEGVGICYRKDGEIIVQIHLFERDEGFVETRFAQGQTISRRAQMRYEELPTLDAEDWCPYAYRARIKE